MNRTPPAPSILPRLFLYACLFLLFLGIVCAFPILSILASILAAKIALETHRRQLKTKREVLVYLATLAERGSGAIVRYAARLLIRGSRWVYSYLTKPHRSPPKTPIHAESKEENPRILGINENGVLPEFVFSSIRYELPKPAEVVEESPKEDTEYANPLDLALLLESGVFSPKPPHKTRGRKTKSLEA